MLHYQMVLNIKWVGSWECTQLADLPWSSQLQFKGVPGKSTINEFRKRFHRIQPSQPRQSIDLRRIGWRESFFGNHHAPFETGGGVMQFFPLNLTKYDGLILQCHWRVPGQGRCWTWVQFQQKRLEAKEKSCFFAIGTLWDSQDSTVGNHGTKALLFLGMTDFTAVDGAELPRFNCRNKIILVTSWWGCYTSSIYNILDCIK